MERRVQLADRTLSREVDLGFIDTFAVSHDGWLVIIKLVLVGGYWKRIDWV